MGAPTADYGTGPTALRLFPVAQEQLTSDDYYTPRWVFDRMGLTFDLDVCTPPGGIPWIPATRYYTQADDGLAQAWFGRVWLNPPFSAPIPWIHRFIEHAHGVCLVPCSAGAWFHDLWVSAHGVCLPVPMKMRFARQADDGFVLFPGGLPIRLAMFAFGDECVEAISRLGPVRVSPNDGTRAQ
jgi:DNA N-6-adenine-methyltransferase (Dam)